MMNSKITYFLICLFVFPISKNSKCQEGNEILWGDHEINWNDFKGIPNPNISSNYLANLTSSINIDGKYVRRDSVVYFIKAYMNKDLSWTRTNSDTILNHERRHFDITEIYVRKLRKLYWERHFKRSTLNRDLDLYYKLILAERNQKQDIYDKETNHGINYMKQLEWDKRIRSELQQLKEFEKVSVPLMVNWKN